jgi:hypothetical protein
MITTEIVYKNRDNPNVVSFFEDNVAMDFSSVTRTVLKLYNNNLALQLTEDSDNSPSLISWATNEITFNINDLVISNGRYQAEVIIYDSSHPNGQVIAHPKSAVDTLVFEYVTS